jgi:negative regulator of replication initiation
MDEEAYDIIRRMQVMKETEQNMLASTRRVPSQQELMRNDEQARDMEQQLRRMSEDRKVKMGQLQMQRKRVDGYLKVMSVTHARMAGIEPSVLRSMQ